MDKKFDIAKVSIECEAQSHRILNCYIRYMIKKLKLRKYDHSVFITCSRYDDYVLHINGLLIKTREFSFYKNNSIRYSPTKCHEIDLLIERFVLRKYKIKIIYDETFKASGKLILKPFRITYLTLIRDIICDLKLRPSIKTKKEKKIKNLKNNEVLIIGHEFSNANAAYINLTKKLSNHLHDLDLDLNSILPFDIGLTFYDKIKNLKLILKTLLSKFLISGYLKLSDINFIIYEIYRKIYKKKLKNYFLKNKISYVVCSYINSQYESIYYEAAKELKIKYFNYDYSLGYPVKDKIYLRYLPDTRKFCDVIFSNSNFRTEQYLMSSSFLTKKPLIFNHICPQLDYSLRKKSFLSFKSSDIKIGIVDNISYEDCGLSYDDLFTLIKFFKNNKLPFKFILQSKRGDLEEQFIKLNFNKKNYVSGRKGDFSLLRNSDLIISIGWQSIALKAASTFEKPLIFYSQNGYPYKGYIFSINKQNNQIINNLCNDLWFSEKDLNNKLNKLFLDNHNLDNVRDLSMELLNQIYFHKENIEDYFKKYFK